MAKFPFPNHNMTLPPGMLTTAGKVISHVSMGFPEGVHLAFWEEQAGGEGETGNPSGGSEATPVLERPQHPHRGAPEIACGEGLRGAASVFGAARGAEWRPRRVQGV